MIYHILGNGGFAREVVASLKNEQGFNSRNDEILFYEDCKNKSAVDTLTEQYKTGEILLAVGSPKLKEKWDKELEQKFCTKNTHLRGMYSFVFAGLNAGKFIDHDTISWEDSPIICHGAVLTTNVTLGKFVNINLNCTIGHDSSIGDYSTLHPGVNISGNVKIGKGCEIGSNVVIIPGVSLPDYGTVGAGSVVTKTPNLGDICREFEMKTGSNIGTIENYMMAGNPAVVKKVNGVKIG